MGVTMYFLPPGVEELIPIGQGRRLPCNISEGGEADKETTRAEITATTMGIIMSVIVEDNKGESAVVSLAATTTTD